MSLGRFFVNCLKCLPKSWIKPIAFRYVAGESMDDAVTAVRMLNARGIRATVDVLGESARDADYVREYVAEYRRLIDAIVAHQLQSGISFKLTAFGMEFDTALAERSAEEVVTYAAERGIFTRIDMENTPYTDATIALYNRLRARHPRLGVVLQAYLKRTRRDISAFSGTVDLRLCKGIYIESPEVAIKDYQGIRDNYLTCLRDILQRGFHVGIATHDEYLVDGARKILSELKPAAGSFEFQMLYGVRGDLADTLVREGHRMRVYVPYGKDWYAYSMRRLYENPGIAWHVTRAILLAPWRWLRGR